MLPGLPIMGTALVIGHALCYHEEKQTFCKQTPEPSIFFQKILNPLNYLKCFTGRGSAPPPGCQLSTPGTKYSPHIYWGSGCCQHSPSFPFKLPRSLVFCLPSLYLSPSLGNEGCVLPGSHYWQKGNPSIRAKDEHCSIAHTHCYIFLNTDINTLIENWKPAIDWWKSK